MAYKKLKLWFDAELASLLADKIVLVYPSFQKDLFVAAVADGTPELELKDRVELMADLLQEHLSGDFEQDLILLNGILGPENEKETGMFSEYYWIMPIAKYVEKYGLDHFAPSMNMIEEITKRNTGEYTIRPFIEKYQETTIAVMLAWAKSPNKHVRRLASEGGRPRLPWAKKLDAFIDDPTPLLPILDQLKDDPSKYVQKSVANCLNDILKDNYHIAREVISSWLTQPIGKQRSWIIRHALRNLKKEDNWAQEVVQGLS